MKKEEPAKQGVMDTPQIGVENIHDMQSIQNNSSLLTPDSSLKSTAFHVMQYLALHIQRSRIKSLLSFGLALLLVGTVGQLTMIRGIYSELYSNMEVKVYIYDSLSIRNAIRLDETEYIRRAAEEPGKYDYLSPPYYESHYGASFECKRWHVFVAMTNDIERYSGGKAEVEFLEGYDLAAMSLVGGDTNNICLMDSQFMEKHGIELGETVSLNRLGLLKNSEEYIEQAENERVRQQRIRDYAEIIESTTANVLVVGRIISGVSDATVIVPVGDSLDALGNHLAYRERWASEQIFEYVEYTLASPDYAEAFYDLAKRAASSSVGVGIMDSPIVMDTSEAENMLRTLVLLDGLYPIAVAAAAIMGGLFPGLIVMQSDREAAIMRALGTTKKRTRTMLVLEQVALCVLGILCAALLLLAINGIIIPVYSKTLSAYSALHITTCTAGALTCAIIITRRRILELLQVKE